MSLINDLLSKVKQQEPKRDIPPLLKESIMQGSSRRKVNSRIMVSLVIFIVAALVGILAVHSLDYFIKPSLVALKGETVTQSPPVPLTATAPVTQQSLTAASGQPDPGSYNKQAQTVAINKSKDVDVPLPVIKNKTARIVKKDRERVIEKIKEVKQQQASKVENEGASGHKEKISRQDKDLYLYTARAYENDGNYQMALSNYRSILTVDPGNYMVMNNIASALIQLSSFEEAIGYAEQALRIRKRYVPSLINLGIAYSRLGKYAEGERSMKEALSVEPSNRFALINIGLLYERRDMYEKAGEYYLRLTNMGDVQGYLGLARISEKQNKTTAAISYYRTAMSIENKNSQIWNFANDRLLQLMK